MQERFLTDDEQRQVLDRAQQLLSADQKLDVYRAFIDAAEEVGIPRNAVEQALLERLNTPKLNVAPDAMVWAPGADGHLYPAKVKSTTETHAEILFSNGAHSHVLLDQIQSFALTPGLKIEAQLPSWNYWTLMDVQTYNPVANAVTISYWGTEYTITLDKLRLPTAKKAVKTPFTFEWRSFLFGLLSASCVFIGILVILLANR